MKKNGGKKASGKAGGGGKLPPWMPESMTSAGRAGRSSAKPGAAAPRSARNTSKPPRLPGAVEFDAPARSRQATRGMAPTPAPRRPHRPTPAFDPHAEREALRYENPIASREAILALLAEADGPLDAEQIAQRLTLSAPDRFDALTKRLAAMLRDGQLLANRRGHYAVAQSST
jgi:ribonuclease R